MKHLLIFILAIPLTLSHYEYGEKRNNIEPYKLNDSKDKKDKKCTAKGRFKGDDACNWCFCDKGATMCTSMRCAKKKEKLVSNVEACKQKPMGRFKAEDGCNWCYCIDANTPICTQMACYKPKKLKRSKDSNVCEAKDRKPGRVLHPDGCNWCYCIGSKQMMCTIMGCPKPAGQTKEGISTQFVFQSGNFRFVDSGNYTMCIRVPGKNKGNGSLDFTVN
ncbi:U-reduvitoxin-Pr21-like [Cydia fagiglandana]|uniref:U-reduvitoxin-Pr21-like n=1 Tax=Cydia fagiglandana TaxID=1458189 RepID=UPI002FEE0804